MNVDTVSIVITTMEYQLKYLKKLLESMENQTHKLLDVVIVDKTKTNEVRNAFEQSTLNKKYKIISDDTPRGFAANYNLGINHAEGSIVFVLNLDTLLAPDCLERCVEAMLREPSIGCITPKILRMNEDQVPYAPAEIDAAGMCLTRFMRHFDRGAGEIDRGQYDEPTYVFGATGAGVFYTRECLDDIKFNNQYFDEDFWSYREDADLSWRIQNYGWKCLYEPRTVMYHVRTLKPRQRPKSLMLANMHSVKNRYLLMLNNMSARNYFLHLPTILLRDIIVISGVLIKERYSLRAFKFIVVNFLRLLAKRAKIQKRMKGDASGFWFKNRAISFPINV